MSFREGDRIVVVRDPLAGFMDPDTGYPTKSDEGCSGVVLLGAERNYVTGPVLVRLDNGGGEHWFGIGCLDFVSIVDKLASLA